MFVIVLVLSHIHLKCKDTHTQQLNYWNTLNSISKKSFISFLDLGKHLKFFVLFLVTFLTFSYFLQWSKKGVEKKEILKKIAVPLLILQLVGQLLPDRLHQGVLGVGAPGIDLCALVVTDPASDEGGQVELDGVGGHVEGVVCVEHFTDGGLLGAQGDDGLGGDLADELLAAVLGVGVGSLQDELVKVHLGLILDGAAVAAAVRAPAAPAGSAAAAGEPVALGGAEADGGLEAEEAGEGGDGDDAAVEDALDHHGGGEDHKSNNEDGLHLHKIMKLN